MSSKRKSAAPDVRHLDQELTRFFSHTDVHGRKLSTVKCGIYAFYDYDGEPIYVGQTRERISGRVRRHLTNQRTDAVAMNVLDPFEVAEIEVWPLDLTGTDAEVKAELDAYEYTVYDKLLTESKFGAVLNEVIPRQVPTVELPPSFRASIVPALVRESREHPDVRLARRAATMAALAKVISERQVNTGLRVTLHTQSRRLEDLANRRLDELQIKHAPYGSEGDQPEDEA